MLSELLQIGTDLAEFLWLSMLMLAPVLLLGLFLSGLIHVFVSRHTVNRWLQRDDLKSVATSAAVGVPIPLCSCSVLPVVAEMKHKGASRSACMSFLITAPETGADSILITNLFFGWIAAIVRPFVSFATAVIAGLTWMGLSRKEDPVVGESEPMAFDPCCEDETTTVDDCCDSEQPVANDCCYPSPAELDDCCADASGHEYLVPTTEDCYVSLASLRGAFEETVRALVHKGQSLVSAFNRVAWFKAKKADKPSAASAGSVEIWNPDMAQDPLTIGRILRHVFRYGFVSIADDILVALLIGVFLGGIIYLAVPADLMANEYARWISYPVMLLIAMPLYICASASTPIAAALVAKGCSPGAALIFLMTGPATNTATISVIMSQFGTKFASIYLSVVMVVTFAFGVLVDFLLIATGLQITVNLEPAHNEAIQLLQYASLAAFAALVVWRFRAGALQSGWRDVMVNLRALLARGRTTN